MRSSSGKRQGVGQGCACDRARDSETHAIIFLTLAVPESQRLLKPSKLPGISSIRFIFPRSVMGGRNPLSSLIIAWGMRRGGGCGKEAGIPDAAAQT